MASNGVMITMIVMFLSVCVHSMWRGQLDYRCCTDEDVASGLCGHFDQEYNETFAIDHENMAVCGEGYDCQEHMNTTCMRVASGPGNQIRA